MSNRVDLSESVSLSALDDIDIGADCLEELAFRSAKVNRKIALHPKASPDLLARLAQAPDKQTRRNVTLNPQTPKEVLIDLAPAFAGEFFKNPVFDFLLIEDPNLLFSLPVSVMKSILKRDDCPESLLDWAVNYGDKSHQLAVVSRNHVTRSHLNRISSGSNVKAAEIAAGRLIAGDFDA